MVLENEDEIRLSATLYRGFLKTGMFLSPQHRGIDMGALEAEHNESESENWGIR